jgi:hypothetical protein
MPSMAMTRTQIYFRDQELAVLRQVAKRSGKSVAELVREAVRQIWMRPEHQRPVALWHGEPRRTSTQHDIFYDKD